MCQQTGTEIETHPPEAVQFSAKRKNDLNAVDESKSDLWFSRLKNTEKPNSDVPIVETFWEATVNRLKAGEKSLKRSFMSLRGK